MCSRVGKGLTQCAPLGRGQGVQGMAEMACKPHAKSSEPAESTRAGEFRKYPARG